MPNGLQALETNMITLYNITEIIRQRELQNAIILKGFNGGIGEKLK